MPGEQTDHSTVKGEHTRLTQDGKQDNFLRLGKNIPHLQATGLMIPMTTRQKSFDVAMVFEVYNRKSYVSSGISMNDDTDMKSGYFFLLGFLKQSLLLHIRGLLSLFKSIYSC